MITVNNVAIGTFNWNESEQARIEKNRFLYEGEIFEGLRFCKFRNGRHTRIHLVIREEDWVKLFQDSVKKGVFSKKTISAMKKCLNSGD